VIGKYSHSVNYQSNLVIKLVFLVLETLLSITLSITELLLFFRRLLAIGLLLFETSEEIAHAGVSAKVRGPS